MAVKNTTRGAIAGFDGSFRLDNVEGSRFEIRCTGSGYKDFDDVVDTSAPILISLTPSVNQISDVVVTCFFDDFGRRSREMRDRELDIRTLTITRAIERKEIADSVKPASPFIDLSAGNICSSTKAAAGCDAEQMRGELLPPPP